MIRRASYRLDHSSIIRLAHRELWPYKQLSFPGRRFPRKEVIRRLRKREVFVKVSDKGTVIGFIMMKAQGGSLFIDMLAVDRSAQGHGIGKSLLCAAERLAMRRRCQNVRLFVDDMNWRAMQFYNRMGYVSINYVHEIRCYLYEKSL